MKARNLLAASLALVSSAQVFAAGSGGPIVAAPDSASVAGLLALGVVAIVAFRRKSK